MVYEKEFITKRLLKSIPIKFNVTDSGCTAFVTKNENGDIIFARNFDFDYAPSMQLDKLQWSVIYNLSNMSGEIWAHRNKNNIIDFKL